MNELLVKWKPVGFKLFLTAAVGMIASVCVAQSPSFSGMYYQNQYIANPAMAGINDGLKLNLAFRQQWSPMPGSPKNQLLAADYNGGKKVGLGLLLMNDEAGLIKRTRAMATYSYHLPLNDETKKLRFGVSLGIMDERVLNEDLNGDQGDMSVSRFNQRDVFVDGDFGIAYTSSRLTLQGALPNLKGLVIDDEFSAAANRYTYFSAISYRFQFPTMLDGLGIEPKLAVRGLSQLDDIIDIGTNLTVANNAANIVLLYHSSNNATIGFGANIKALGSINAHYTTATNAIKGYTGGNFEMSVLVNLIKPGKN